MIPRLAAVTCVFAGLATITAADPSDFIGRLSHAGFKSRAHCTATRLASGHIVTAAHCLPGIATDTVTIALGYDRGKAGDVVRAPGTDFVRDADRDLALLCGTGTRAGIALGAPKPGIGETVRVAGYGVPRVHVVQVRECGIDARSQSAFALSCPSPPGTSGGPVLRPAQNGLELIGVVSASNANRTIAVSVTADDIARLCPD